MVDNRVVSVELPLSDGQSPIYNSTTDKFTPGTATGTSAVINGTNVFTPPVATGSLSLVGGQAATDNGQNFSIVLGANASTQNLATITIGQFASTGGQADVAIGFGATSNLTGAFDSGGVILGTGSTNGQAAICLGGGGVNSSLSISAGRNASVNSNALNSVALGSFSTVGNGSINCNDSYAIGYNSRTLRLLGTNLSFNRGEPTVTGQISLAPGYNPNEPGTTALGMLQLSGTGSNGVTPISFNLALFDGTTSIANLDTSINNPSAGMFVLEAFVVGADTTHANEVKAFTQTYSYDFAHGATPFTLVLGTNNTFTTNNTRTSAWTLGLSVNGSGVFTLPFSAGAAGTYTAYALLRFI